MERIEKIEYYIGYIETYYLEINFPNDCDLEKFIFWLNRVNTSVIITLNNTDTNHNFLDMMKTLTKIPKNFLVYTKDYKFISEILIENNMLMYKYHYFNFEKSNEIFDKLKNCIKQYLFNTIDSKYILPIEDINFEIEDVNYIEKHNNYFSFFENKKRLNFNTKTFHYDKVQLINSKISDIKLDYDVVIPNIIKMVKDEEDNNYLLLDNVNLDEKINTLLDPYDLKYFSS